MPQASEELGNRWRGPSPDYAEGYLEGRGYILDENYQWRHLDGYYAEPNETDFNAMDFLALEWDYGDFNPEPCVHLAAVVPHERLMKSSFKKTQKGGWP